MTQTTIDFTRPQRFDGADIDNARDSARLTGQLRDVFEHISDGQWHTVASIARATSHPEPSVSAQLRNLRKKRFGSHIIERRYAHSGLYEFRLNGG